MQVQVTCKNNTAIVKTIRYDILSKILIIFPIISKSQGLLTYVFPLEKKIVAVGEEIENVVERTEKLTSGDFLKKDILLQN